jgi:tRNA pseudouridine38-40 synthase
MTLGYRGTRYAGWAIQSRSTRPTVQATVESALCSALGHRVRVTAAGRTDAGVHADAQVVSFETTCSVPADRLPGVLTRFLPDDVWPVEAADVPPSFDARHSAVRRWYRYALWRSGVPPAAWQARCVVHPRALDVPAMRRAARALIGRHDFASLVTRPSAQGSTERTVFVADWLEVSPSLLLFEICADAYLKQMVRTIIGSLLWVGNGRWTADHFASALTRADRRAAGPTAPPSGLSLHRIEY